MSAAENKAVFLSYASQDAEVARRICEALRDADVVVWFDQSELVGGDAWDAKIRGQIASCALFIPVISAGSQARREGYFRREWKQAAARTHDMADGTPFLLPVVIDATRDAEALVPEEFRAVQWTRLSGGAVSPQFVERVKTLLGGGAAARAFQRVEERENTRWKARATRTGLRLWIALATVIVIGATATFVAMHSREPSAGPNTKLRTQNSSPVDLAPAKSIAVLPFENRSEDKDGNAFFADGMHDELLSALAKIGALKVISRTSVLEYRDPAKKRNLKQIGSELGVAHILEGSVSRSGKTVRIIVQLIDAATGVQRWAETYPLKEVTDVFQVQADLAGKISQSLSVQLSPKLKQGLARKLTANPQAYDLYLQVQPTEFGSRGDADEQTRKLQEAVRLDPKFAAAWARLSVVYSLEHRYSSPDLAPARLARAKETIETALRIDPESAEVRAAYGRYFHLCLGDWARATEQYAIALALKPGDAAVLAYLGLTQRHQGNWAEAVVSLERAFSLDPRGGSPDHGQWVGALVAQRQYAKAQQALQRLQQTDDTERNPGRGRAAMLQYLRDGDRARCESALDAIPVTTEAQKTMRVYRNAMQAGRFSEAAGHYATKSEGASERSERVDAIRYCTAAWLAGDRAGARIRALTVLASLPRVEHRQRFDWELVGERALFEAFAGEAAAARESARESMELMPVTRSAVEGPRALSRAAVVHLLIGDSERALNLLNEALGTPSDLVLLSHPDFQPLWGPLRQDPRYRAAVAKWTPRN